MVQLKKDPLKALLDLVKQDASVMQACLETDLLSSDVTLRIQFNDAEHALKYEKLFDDVGFDAQYVAPDPELRNSDQEFIVYVVIS